MTLYHIDEKELDKMFTRVCWPFFSLASCAASLV